MSATPQLVKDIAPELTPQGDPRIQQFIGFAELQVDESRWGTMADLGTAYLAAHLLTVSAAGSGTGGPAGPVTSETVGRVSRSYASPSSAPSSVMGNLGSTSYGREYARMQSLLSLTPEVL